MIWAALAAAIAIAIAASTGGPDEWKLLLKDIRHGIKKHVKDKDRKEAALAVVDAADADMTKTRKALVEKFNEAYTVHRTYSSTMEDYATVVDSVMIEVHAVEKTGLDRRFELQETLEPQEFAAIFKEIQDEVHKDDAKTAKKDAKKEKKAERKAAKGK